jgi:DNA-binding CsgD family transcriptional regulator
MLQGASTAATALPGPRFSARPAPMASVARTSRVASERYDRRSHSGSTHAGAVPIDAAPAPHWRQAAGHQIEQLQQGVAAILTRSDAALALLDCLPFGIVLVDRESTALLVNRRAEQVLGEQDGLVTHGGKLSAARATDTTQLRQSIARTWRLAHGPGPHPSDGFQLARPSGRRPLVIRIVPLQPRIDALAVVVCDPETRRPVEQRLLHQLYRLTRTEAQLVAALADGERLEDAAQALGVTLGTGRTYLKRVFAKMGVSRQADLVRLLLSGPTQFCSD